MGLASGRGLPPSKEKPVSNIIITGFRQTYDKAGKPVDWVMWVPAHAPQAMGNEERVNDLDPSRAKVREGAQSSEKMAYMNTVWAAVEPAYKAWKEGREMPLNGTALAAWPGITPEQAEIFRLAGVRTVEQVRDMSDSVRTRVRLPNTRELQELARMFLENTGAAAAAEREAAKDRQIAEMAERMAAMEELLAQNIKPEAVDAEVTALRTELDARGIKYHHKAGAVKLRELLADTQQEAA
jgi:hypothetical protein